MRLFPSHLRRILLAVTITALLCAPRIAADGGDTIRFRDITELAGLIEPLAGLMGHGGAVGDYDGDGHLDIYVGGFCDRPDREYVPAKGPVANRLLRNSGDGWFAEVNMPSVAIYGRTSGAVIADLDNDGAQDLYV